MLNNIIIFAPFLGFIVWAILATVFLFAGLRDGSLLVADQKNLMVFRTRIAGRVGMAMMSAFPLGFLLLCVIYGLGLIGSVLHHHPVSNPYMAVFTFPFGILLGGGLGGLFLYAAGPRDLRLDLDRHTYQFKCGWPGFSRVQDGPWEDMAGVFVRDICYEEREKRREMYTVEIAWRRERQRCPTLGRFRRWADSAVEAQQTR